MTVSSYPSTHEHAIGFVIDTAPDDRHEAQGLLGPERLVGGRSLFMAA